MPIYFGRTTLETRKASQPLLNQKPGSLKTGIAMPALEHDGRIFGEFIEAHGNLLKEYMYRARNMSRLILPSLAHVDDNQNITLIKAGL